MSGPVVAIGGAEFVMRSENEALHEYVLALAGSPRPRICLLPTASGDPQAQIGAFHTAMERRRCEASSVSLFRLGDVEIDLTAHLLEQEVIYVTGGNMVNLMALWREHGLDRILCEAHRRGTVLCGYSAGSMCWFEHGVSRGLGRPVATPGLGLLPGSHCVHYSQDPPRRSAYRDLVASGAIAPGLALDDHAAALFEDGSLVEAVASKEGAGAFEVAPAPDGRGAVEAPIPTRLLDPPTGDPEQALGEMRAVRRMRSSQGGRRRPLDRSP